jgi:DUF1365 family protein
VFHVSPFCPVEGGYRFEFKRSGARACTPHGCASTLTTPRGPLLLTGVAGRLQPLDAASRRRALWHYPLLTLGVMARIHWHALLLWLKRVPFHRKPAPGASRTRSTPSTLTPSSDH